MRVTPASTCCARGDRSPRLPMGVATTYSVPPLTAVVAEISPAGLLMSALSHLSYFAPMHFLRAAAVFLAVAAYGTAALAQRLPGPAQDRFTRYAYAASPEGPLALLLPLSGSLASTGIAVRDGFLAAAAAAGTPVRVYDAGSGNESAVDAFGQALRDGPSVVVGPLRKEAIAAIATAGAAVPWLALNYLDNLGGENLVQFGLAPEDEARAVADHAYQLGLRRALAMVPLAVSGSDWGERALAAFTARLNALGGEVIGIARYSAASLNFAAPIQMLLGLDESKERHRVLANTLGARSEFEPRRRDDADFLFIAARPADGRLLWPQLRFYRVSDLPAYATSAIYEGKPDNELNGLRVCDMPYMLDGAGAYARLRAEIEGLASASQQPRLFALGVDAYSVAARMRSGELRSTPNFAAATGLLSFGNGAIARQLGCSEFRDGKPRAPAKS